MTPFIICALVLVSVFIDQISKYLVVIYMELGQSVDLIPGVLRFTYVQNDGAAFGSMDDQRWIFMILSTLAIVGNCGVGDVAELLHLLGGEFLQN